MDITTQLDDIIAQDEEGVVTPIYQKNDEPYLAPDGTPCTMTILGAESKRVTKATEATQRRLGRRRKQEDAVQVMRVERAIASVTAWHGWTEGDRPAECTPDNLRKVCRAQHILVQIELARDGHADFFAKTSPT
jgi:hypothetical protein